MSQFPFQPPYAPPAPPQPQYATQPNGYGYAPSPVQQPQGYPYQPPTQPVHGYVPQPQVPQGPPPVAGSLAAFDAQPAGGGGPGLKFPQIGVGYSCVVERTVSDRDVQQDRAPANQGGGLKFFKDGRPQFVMVVPVLIQPDAEHPDGRASLYVRGGIRDALATAGLAGAPQQGDAFTIQLVEQKQTGQTIPKNIFRVEYRHASGPVTAPAPTAPQAPQPPVQVPEQPQAPAPAPQPMALPPYPGAELGMAHPNPQPPPLQAQQQAPAAVPGLPGLSPEQQELLARLQGGSGGGQQ